MIRTASVLLTLGLIVTFLPAADDPESRKAEPATARKKNPNGPKGDALAKSDEGEDKTKELLGRVAKNMGASEDRLKKNDPGTETRKLQDQIVKDLDELIKKKDDDDKKNDAQQNSSQSSSSDSSQSSQSRRASRRSQQKQQSAQSAQQQNSGAKKQGQQKQGETGQDKGAKKDQAASAGGKGQDPKDKGGATPGGGNSSEKKSGTIAELYRDPWGHLPQQKRQEMDAFSRERFMPRYDELLRQYYRTLSESRKKEGD